MVFVNVLKSPVKLVKRVDQGLNISKSSVHCILTTLKFYLFKVHLIQAFHDDDTGRRLNAINRMHILSFYYSSMKKLFSRCAGEPTQYALCPNNNSCWNKGGQFQKLKDYVLGGGHYEKTLAKLLQSFCRPSCLTAMRLFL